ncbi:hypothetical protein [Roseovarius sp. MMSF_3281]|nr:hypothetical protein [Roseovarius sp. MMSF_3281]
MNTFVIPIVTLTLMALLGVFVLRHPSDDENDEKPRRAKAKSSYRKV